MRLIHTLLLTVLLVSTVFAISSCNNLTSGSEDVSDSLDPVENVTPIEGAENSTITVNKSDEAFFATEFTNVGSNTVISNGFSGEGWCIDWQKPIDSDGGVYTDIPLYSTFNVEKWNPLNYFFNIMDNLKQDDSTLTYLEFQAVIWSLRGFPKFDLETISDEDLPNRLLTDGQANFSREKVNTILEIVESGYENFEFTEGTRYAVIAETPSDVQTVITVVE